LFNEKHVAEIWQYFVNIICNIICNLAVNLAGFRICLAKDTVHSLSFCYALLIALMLFNAVLPYGVIQHIFYKNGVTLHVCVHGHPNDFSRGALVDVSQSFSRVGRPKVVKFVFYHLKLRKQRLLLKFSKFVTPSDTHACV